jgi:hypothetical protein
MPQKILYDLAGALFNAMHQSYQYWSIPCTGFHGCNSCDTRLSITEVRPHASVLLETSTATLARIRLMHTLCTAALDYFLVASSQLASRAGTCRVTSISAGTVTSIVAIITLDSYTCGPSAAPSTRLPLGSGWSPALLPLTVLLLLAPQSVTLVVFLLGFATAHTLECSRLTQTMYVSSAVLTMTKPTLPCGITQFT